MMPRFSIQWRLFIRVSDQLEADRKIDEIRDRLRRDLEFPTSDPYWKIKELWECSFQTPVEVGTSAEAVFDCLVLASHLGNGWYILGPDGEGEALFFEGIFDIHRPATSHVAGLEWGSFNLYCPQNDA